MKIKRDQYLNDLIVRMNNGMIKVITGIRRCGKSYLLFELFKNYLLENNISKDHIIMIDLENRENRKFRNPDIIYDYIKSLIIDENNYYVLLDEIQMLNEFEEILNSLLSIKNVDVYVTGSNSKFLSKDVITEFRGRGDEIHIYPLTFFEFMQVFDGDKYEGWLNYSTYGGLPLVATMKNDEQKMKYLTNLFDETYLKDIIERNKVLKSIELEDLINVLASAIGSLTNPTKIADTFKSKLNSSISKNTIIQYIDFLKDAFIINSSYRYDVKGRKYIGTPLKYYFEDVGLRNARLGFRQLEGTHIMENIIYNELRARGYLVDVGVVERRLLDENKKKLKRQYEIDFIANIGNKRYYIQSAYSLPTTEKRNQEKNALVNIKDSFKKIIITNDLTKVWRDDDGIVTMDIYTFLLDKNSLDL